MKLKHVFMGLLGALAMSACTSDDIPSQGEPLGPEPGEARYMSVTIRNANPSTRAEGDQETSDDKTYEEGFSAENDVKSLRFYFFDADGNPAPVKYNGESYYDCSAEDIETGNPGSGMPNTEKILNAVIVINSNTAEGDRDNIKQMVAVINFDNIKDKLTGSSDSEHTGNMSLAELTAVIGTEAQSNLLGTTTGDKFTGSCKVDPGKGFLMSSSSFYDEEGYGCAVEIKDSDIKADIDLAKANPVNVYVERVVAKVRVSMAWTQDMAVEDVSLDGKPYKAVLLKDSKGNPITTGNGSGDQVYVIFKGWNLWMTAPQTYLFKKVDEWSALSPWNWNDKNFFRSYWAENPAGVNAGTLTRRKHSDAPFKFFASREDADYKSDYAAYTAYCLENAADAGNDGLKSTYDPDEATTNRTLVYLQAVLVTVKDGKATPLTLCEWGGYKYTESNLIAAMFQPNQNVAYFRSAEPVGETTETDGDGTTVTVKTYKYIPVQADDLKLVTAQDAGEADDKTENSKRYLSYINLNEDGLFNDHEWEGVSYKVETGKLYYRNGDGKFQPYNSLDEVNTLYESVGGAKVWMNGDTYYYHELRHLNSNDSEGTKGYYGVVRNHIYEVQINTVTGLGTPVLTPVGGEDEVEDIIPQKPTPDAYFLGARINILSWRVVNNGVNLEW